MEILIIFAATFGSAWLLIREVYASQRPALRIQDPEAWRKNVNTNWSKW